MEALDAKIEKAQAQVSRRNSMMQLLQRPATSLITGMRCEGTNW
jgi:hypothetical protein